MVKKLFGELSILNEKEGLNLFIAPSIIAEVDIQQHCGIIQRICILHTYGWKHMKKAVAPACELGLKHWNDIVDTNSTTIESHDLTGTPEENKYTSKPVVFDASDEQNCTDANDLGKHTVGYKPKPNIVHEKLNFVIQEDWDNEDTEAPFHLQHPDLLYYPPMLCSPSRQPEEIGNKGAHEPNAALFEPSYENDSCDNMAQDDKNESLNVQKQYVMVPDDTNKIFISNINYRTSQRKLWEFFKKFGSVERCTILRNNHNKSKGIGFVKFCSEDSANCVLKASESELFLDKRVLSVNVAMKKQWPKEKDNSSVPSWTSSCPVPIDQDTHQADTVDENQLGDHGIQSLNEDCLTVIFSYLNLKERFRCERVCKRWGLIARRCWQSMSCLSFQGMVARFGGFDDKTLRTLLKRGSSNLLELDLSAVSRLLSDSTLAAIGQRCPALQSLLIPHMKVSNNGLKALGSQCRMLQRIDLSGCLDVGEDGLWWLFHQCKNLTSVKLDNNKRLRGQSFHVMTRNIQTLSLNCCSKLQDVGIEKLSQKENGQLEELHINYCTRLTNQTFRSLTSGCQGLQILHIKGTLPSVTPTGLALLGHLTQLQCLDLEDNPAVTDDVMLAIAKGCRRIRVLNVSGCSRNVTDVGIMGLARCRLLETLDISYLHRIQDASFIQLATLASLQHVTARGCGEIGNAGVCALAAGCPALSLVDLSGCGQLTNEVVDAFLISVDICGSSGRHLRLCVGGTSIAVNPETMPSAITIVTQDLCCHHLRLDRDLVLGDSDDEFEEFGEEADFDGDAYREIDEVEQYLDADDPLAEEFWDIS